MSGMVRKSAFSVYKELSSGETHTDSPVSPVSPVSRVSPVANVSYVSQPEREAPKVGKRKRAHKDVPGSGKKKRKIKKSSVEEVEISGDKVPTSADEQIVDSCVSTEVGDGPFYNLFKPSTYSDSREAATELFKWLIHPLSSDTFFSDIWEKRPMVMQRHRPHYNDGWFSSQELDSILRERYVEFGTNIDLTTYEGGKRRTHNPLGRAMPGVVWQHFQEGCSVRLLNPQTFSKTVWLLNSTLQELFNCCVGANTYLTPAGSQGFAPHYDDIEAFVMQLEGRKKWRLYEPRNDAEILPRFSSGNFTESDIGEPMMEVVLEPGDLLYFPRGFIHQASTPPDSHSLHITLSAYQKNSWADFLEKLLPAALQVAVQEEPELRSGLPLDFLNYTGVVHLDSGDSRREPFQKRLSYLFSKLLEHAPVDAAADQLGVRYIREALPPCGEPASLVGGGGARWEGDHVVEEEGIKWTGKTRVRLLQGGIVRLVVEDECTVLYSTVHNSRCPEEKEPVRVELEDYEAPVVDYLIKSYPQYVSIARVPSDASTQNKVDTCSHLYQHGLLIIRN